VQTSFQVLVNVLDHGMNVQQAVEAPKWSHRPGTLPGGDEQPYLLALERRVDDAVVAELGARGHHIERVPAYAFGAHKVIARDSANGVLMGAASPVRDGYAMGW
jgi:gamma-glutamyltranspeptidase/glutathione hydrolase